MTQQGQHPLVPPSGTGRSFRGRRRVRQGDVDRSGRLRTDSLLRYTQDVSDDDTAAAGLDSEPGWVARRSVIDVVSPARLDEELEVETFCGGLGPRWAERRLGVRGSQGACYEVSTLWICVDPREGRPLALTDQFVALYGPAADGRRASARLTLPSAPPRQARPGSGRGVGDTPGATLRSWPLRVVDYDVRGHVNNAAYGVVVEECVDGRWPAAAHRVTIEYRTGVTPRPGVTVAELVDGDRLLLWWLLDEGEVAAVASVERLPAEIYSGAGPAAPEGSPSVVGTGGAMSDSRNSADR